MNDRLHWRYSTAGVFFVLLGVMIFVQLLRLQVSSQAEIFRQQGELYAGYWRTVQPARGQIYDRWGNLLAGNETVYQIGVDLSQVRDPESIAFAMAAVLGKDYQEMLEIASQLPDENSVYVVLADFISPDKVLALQSLESQYADDPNPDAPIQNLDGLIYSPHLQRSYPEKDLAANVLGFVSRNGQGYFGVEEKYYYLLAGVSEDVWIPNDPNRVEELPDIPPGADLILTIDREIQAEVESILTAAIEENGAEAGSILVVDPATGEILAMAATPRINLNEYWLQPDIISGTAPFNRSVSKAYEPGSVFKVLTMAAALDGGYVEPGTTFYDTGLFEIGGAQILNWNSGAWGEQTMLGCMQYSLNVCLAWVASEIGPQDFYTYMDNFGLGHTTGIDLAGEISGRLKIPGDSDWFAADLGTNSFGQGVSVTPIQMVMAVSALANNGEMMAPHVLRAMVSNGRQYQPAPQMIGNPISAETARTISDMLATSLENEASIALVPGYRLAGKTGTGEIATAYGYTSEVTNTSFVGWGPVDNPQFLVYVWFEKPQSSIWGSEVAAPVFRQVVERLVVLLDIPPELDITAGVLP